MAIVMEETAYERKYQRAKEQIEEIRGFYINVTCYLVIIPGLAMFNYWIDQWHHMWFLWAAGGWGIGIFFHALNTFKKTPFFSKKWEEEKIRKFMEQDEKLNKWK